MSKLIDITGQKFNRLTAIKKKDGENWLFKCDCGNEKVINGYYVRKGKTKSCGCLNAELASKRLKTHGLTNTREYGTWSKMKDRCLNPKEKAYKNYGARGITICNRWLESFENFIGDMGLMPTQTHSLDRIDNNKGYFKENCRWATRKEQSVNKRTSFYIIYKNETKALAEWCDILSLNYSTIHRRLKILKWDINKAFETPILK